MCDPLSYLTHDVSPNTGPELASVYVPGTPGAPWTEDEINLRLDKIMVGSFKHIWETGEQHKIPLRTAAFTVACTRVLQAREERGLYP